jgi:hypothetical protein
MKSKARYLFSILTKSKEFQSKLYEKAHTSGLALKKVFFIFFILAFFLSLNAEEGFISPVTISSDVSNYNPLPISIEPRSIYNTSDNGVIALAITEWQIDELLNAFGVTAVRLNQWGNLIWQRSYLLSLDHPTIVGIDIDRYESVRFLATYEDHARLMRIDSQGNAEYSELAVVNPENLLFTKALRMENGDIIALGKCYNIQTEVNDLAFFRLHPTGEIAATSFIPPDGSFDDADAYDAVVDDNDIILLACRIHPEYNDLLNLDVNGYITNRTHLPGDLLFTDRFVHLSHLPGSDHTLAIYRYDTGLPGLESSMISFTRITDEDMTYQSFGYESIAEIYSMIESDDGVIVCGISSTSMYPSSIFKFGFDDEYNLSWLWNYQQILFQYPETSVAYDLLTTNDAGSLFSVGIWGNSFVFVKLLSNGQVPIIDDLQGSSSQTISIFPNPMRNEIHIRLPQNGQLNINHTIEVLNVRGQVVRTLKISGYYESEVIWDGEDIEGSECSDGLYFIKYKNDNHILKKFIKAN